MATPRLNRVLLVVLGAWAVFGSWSLFRSDTGDTSGLDPLVGHVVVFFFVSLAALALATRRWGSWKGAALGVGGLVVASAVSEALQPVLTDSRQAQISDLGGDIIGILGAVALTGVLISVLGHRSRRSWVTAGLCVVGLVASVAVTAYEFDAVRYAIDCRDAGYEPIASVAGGPIIRVIGDMAQLGDTPSKPLRDGEISGDSADLRCSVLDDNAYTIVATVVPASIESNGPTRIFTSSSGTSLSQVNTHIGQEFDQLSIRVRSNRGVYRALIPDVFSAGERVTVALVAAGGQAVVFVDGTERAVFAVEGTSFADWDPGFPILVGDEATRDRTFDGEIEQVLVFDRAFSVGDQFLP